jgi:hypothetical protein
VYSSIINLRCESKGKGAVDYEDRGHEQKEIELDKVLLSDALGGPGTVMVIPLDAHIAV